MDLGPDPVHGEGHQAYTHFRIEALDRLHQADVALLDQVGLRQALTGIAACYMHDKAQMGEHHLPSGFEVLLVIETLGQLAFLLGGQQRYAVDRMHVSLQVGARD
jgi:hypothetical protein